MDLAPGPEEQNEPTTGGSPDAHPEQADQETRVPPQPTPGAPSAQAPYNQPPAYGQDPQPGYGQPSAPGQTYGYGYVYGYPALPPADPRTQPAYGVGPVEAVKRFYQRYAFFYGRASRSEFWWVQLYLFLIQLLPLGVLIAGLAATGHMDSDTGNNNADLMNYIGVPAIALYFLIVLGHVVPSLAVTVRRLHDAGLSGFWYFLMLVPYVGWIPVLVMTIMPPQPEGARFDR